MSCRSFIIWVFSRIRASVAPKSVRWAVPCSVLAVIYHKALHEWSGYVDNFENPVTSETTMWTLFTTILGFLVVFRAQLSYARYWEGITLVERACAVWMNGVSNLFAFVSADPKRQEEVNDFQHITARLISLLVCHSMCEISRRDRSHFPHLDMSGVDPSSLEYLDKTSSKQHVVLQWLQRLVVDKSRSGVIDIAPPILSRVFQEFSIGIVHFVDARKLTAVPFPFQFAEMVVMMLAFFTTVPVPLICAIGIKSIIKAAIYTFLISFVFWSVHYIAVEIEHPFGDDANDLPLELLNARFNKVLVKLLDPKAQNTPCLIREDSSPERRRPSVIAVGSPSAMLPTQSCARLAFSKAFGGTPQPKRPGAHVAARMLHGVLEGPGDVSDDEVVESLPTPKPTFPGPKVDVAPPKLVVPDRPKEEVESIAPPKLISPGAQTQEVESLAAPKPMPPDSQTSSRQPSKNIIGAEDSLDLAGIQWSPAPSASSRRRPFAAGPFDGSRWRTHSPRHPPPAVVAPFVPAGAAPRSCLLSVVAPPGEPMPAPQSGLGRPLGALVGAQAAREAPDSKGGLPFSTIMCSNAV